MPSARWGASPSSVVVWTLCQPENPEMSFVQNFSLSNLDLSRFCKIVDSSRGPGFFHDSGLTKPFGSFVSKLASTAESKCASSRNAAPVRSVPPQVGALQVRVNHQRVA
jgi:hypothetical protein